MGFNRGRFFQHSFSELLVFGTGFIDSGFMAYYAGMRKDIPFADFQEFIKLEIQSFIYMGRRLSAWSSAKSRYMETMRLSVSSSSVNVHMRPYQRGLIIGRHRKPDSNCDLPADISKSRNWIYGYRSGSTLPQTWGSGEYPFDQTSNTKDNRGLPCLGLSLIF